MALTYKLGKNLATATLKGVQTGLGKRRGDTDAFVITIEGPVAALEDLVPAQGATHADFAYIPEDCYVQSSSFSSDRGKGIITINCVDPGADSEQTPATPTKITYRLTMAEEQTDLIAHPVITASTTVVRICLAWLATDDSKKVDENGNYQYVESDGTTYTPISDTTAIKFCDAWMHGIKTFNRYFPVVEKISTYKRVPGLTLTGATITGGTVSAANFGGNIGTWNTPAITLSGFASTGFFKSKYDWTQNAKSSWTLNEQWAWTPDGSASAYGWIYQDSNADADQNSNAGADET